jgi:nucleoside-diphosphate-sugar epimerase
MLLVLLVLYILDLIMTNKSFWCDKTVGVTGSSGFVGSAIANKLRQKGASVVEISRRAGVDIHNFSELVNSLKNANYIISTAAIDGNNEFKQKNSTYILEENVEIISSVLAAASQLKIHDLTILSSAAVYGEGNGSNFSEEYDLFKYAGDCRDGYALSKRVTESFAKEYSHQYGGKVLVPRPTNIYGKHDPHMRVISTLAEKIRNEEELEIWGDGTQKRSFVYLEDFVSVLLLLIEQNVEGIINIAGRENVGVLELAKIISVLLKKTPVITYINEKSVQADRVLDTSRLESFINYNYTSLREGLSKSIIN